MERLAFLADQRFTAGVKQRLAYPAIAESAVLAIVESKQKTGDRYGRGRSAAAPIQLRFGFVDDVCYANRSRNCYANVIGGLLAAKERAGVSGAFTQFFFNSQELIVLGHPV